jgi:isocitrate lyase
MMPQAMQEAIEQLERDWRENPRWQGITRPYSAADVVRLRGSVQIEYTLAKLGAQRLWELMHTEPYVAALGALTGTQAVQMVQAGLKAIYLSGWQVAADANLALQTYPDLSLYPVNSVPAVVKRINNAFRREDEKQHALGRNDIYWYAPIVADGEAGFGGMLHTFELTKALIEAGAAGVHYEDQLASAKKCGHLGGKVLVPTREFIQKLVAARLAADVMGVPTILIARTDALNATLLTSDIDPYDQPFLTGERTYEGFYVVRNGIEAAIARGLAYAPYADLLWFETSTPDLSEARQFAEAIHQQYPWQAAGVQLLPVVQLEEAAGRRHDCPLPAGAGRDGLQVPVHHAGGLPRAQLQLVPVGARLCRDGDDRLRRPAGSGVSRRASKASAQWSIKHSSAPPTSTPCRKPSRAGRRPPLQCTARRRRSSSDKQESERRRF